MKIALLHRYPIRQIPATNAALIYMLKDLSAVITFRKFNRHSPFKAIKSVAWIIYAPLRMLFTRYDIIYCDDSFPFYCGLVKLVRPNATVVLRLGDLHLMYYFRGRLYRWLHKLEVWSWNKVDAILPISETMSKYVKTQTNTKVITVLDPVDTKHFKPSNYERRLIVMWHGLITRNKGLDVILETALLLPGVIFWILGDGPDKPRLIKKAPRNVLFLGHEPFERVPAIINECEVGLAIRADIPGNDYVVTSAWLQYLAMNKPCIASARKVYDDIGYKSQFVSAQDLSSKITYLLKNPQKNRNGREYIKKNHDANHIGRKIIWTLKSVALKEY